MDQSKKRTVILILGNTGAITGFVGKVFSYLEMLNVGCLPESAPYWALYLQLPQGHCFHPLQVQSFYLCFLRNITLLIILCHKSVQRTGIIHQLLSFLKSLSGLKKKKNPPLIPHLSSATVSSFPKDWQCLTFCSSLHYYLGSILLLTVIALAMVTNELVLFH